MLMGLISSIVLSASKRARARRATLFVNSFRLSNETRILDLGCGDGSHIASVVRDTEVRPENVFLADIGEWVQSAADRYGFNAVQIPESGRLPFEDEYFDIVFCSSAIEHVTISKSRMWVLRSGAEFRRLAASAQEAFATEIARLGRQYYVQTPNKWFPIESHTWLPFVGWLPRRILVPLLKFTNRVWAKRTAPDWHLLTSQDMRRLFPGARVEAEKYCGMTKSVVAIKSD